MTAVKGSKDRHLLVFQVAGRNCAIPVEQVREVALAPALLRTPGQPASIEGFLNLRGLAIPVVRLRRLFDLPPAEPGLYAPLIVVESLETAMALLADRVDGIADVGGDDLRPLDGGHSFNDCAEAQFIYNGDGATLLSCERILLAKERRCVAELRARAQSVLDEIEGLQA